MVPPNAAWRSGGCPILENIKNWDSEPDVFEDIPAHGRDVGLLKVTKFIFKDLLQPEILGFCDSQELCVSHKADLGESQRNIKPGLCMPRYAQ